MTNDDDQPDNVTELKKTFTITDGREGFEKQSNKMQIPMEDWRRMKAAMLHARINRRSYRPKDMAITRMIHKYPLRIGQTVLQLPRRANFLKAAVQDGQLCAWFIFDIKYADQLEEQTFLVTGTGHKVPTLAVYLETFLLDTFVGHVFWCANEKDLNG